jgi:hypothetical protein
MRFLSPQIRGLLAESILLFNSLITCCLAPASRVIATPASIAAAAQLLGPRASGGCNAIAAAAADDDGDDDDDDAADDDADNSDDGDAEGRYCRY